jgi:deoxyribodipyrimidine photo-lyase
MTRTGVVLFTRDLRVHDNAALATAARECDAVVPLFVLDPRLLTGANRVSFLLESLADLRRSLSGALVVRRGDPVVEVARFAPDAVYLSADVSGYARERERRVRERSPVRAFEGATVIPPALLAPAGGVHYQVFTPYWRKWSALDPPSENEPSLRPRLPVGVEPGPIPRVRELVAGARPASSLPTGGERAGLALLEQFLQAGSESYEGGRHALSGKGTSRLSPYLHLGCVSPAEVARRARKAGAEELVRQLCWRDFFAQLLAAHPELTTQDLRPARRPWRADADGVAAWKEGRTGYPVVDAAMRQLRDEGWVSNRARMVVASFLTRHLLVDWRVGAAHFLEHLVDGDLASNTGNWQWVAGTGSDTRPGRIFNPTLQGRRFDPEGDWVRQYVPELSPLPASRVHDPSPGERRDLGYPQPIVDHRSAAQRAGRVL